MVKPNPVTTPRNVVIGETFDHPEVSGRLAPCHIINAVRDIPGSGSVWVKHYNHWHIVASYQGGVVCNGRYLLVPATAESIAAIVANL